MLIQVQCSAMVVEVIGEDGERQLRRAAAAIPLFEPSRAVVAELPAGVDEFGLAGSVGNQNDTSLRTTAAGVNFPIARMIFSIVGQRVHGAPFDAETPPACRFATAGQGRRAPRLRS
jgi:hypothetical protein